MNTLLRTLSLRGSKNFERLEVEVKTNIENYEETKKGLIRIVQKLGYESTNAIGTPIIVGSGDRSSIIVNLSGTEARTISNRVKSKKII